MYVNYMGYKECVSEPAPDHMADRIFLDPDQLILPQQKHLRKVLSTDYLYSTGTISCDFSKR